MARRESVKRDAANTRMEWRAAEEALQAS